MRALLLISLSLACQARELYTASSMCRVTEQPMTRLSCSNEDRPIHHLHMRKAGGTTIRENLHAACKRQWDSFEETEWGAYNWSRHDASRVVSLRPPLERLLSSYLFEGGVKQCWNWDEGDGPIDLTGDEPNPSWSQQNWSFVQSCFMQHLQVKTPFDRFMANHSQSVNRTFIEKGDQKYYGANYYLQKILAGRSSSSCGPVDVAPQNWPCQVEEARKALLGSFDMVVIFARGAMYALRATRPAIRVPCCVDAVPWLRLRKFSAEGNIHENGWLDARIKDLTKALEQQIPKVYPKLWRELAEANAADRRFFDSIVDYAAKAHRC